MIIILNNILDNTNLYIQLPKYWVALEIKSDDRAVQVNKHILPHIVTGMLVIIDS